MLKFFRNFAVSNQFSRCFLVKRARAKTKLRTINETTMIQKKKIIKVPTNCILQIAKSHGVTRAAVYNALGYRSNSEQAGVIRKEAMELYGGIKADVVYF